MDAASKRTAAKYCDGCSPGHCSGTTTRRAEQALRSPLVARSEGESGAKGGCMAASLQILRMGVKGLAARHLVMLGFSRALSRAEKPSPSGRDHVKRASSRPSPRA